MGHYIQRDMSDIGNKQAERRRRGRESSKRYREANRDKARACVRRHRIRVQTDPIQRAAKNAKQRERYANLSSEKKTAYCKKVKDYTNALSTKRKQKIKDDARNNMLLREYGITQKDFLAMLESQDFKCVLCGGDIADGGQKTHIDHCHETNIVRGVLCSNCNQGLGLLKDDPTLFKRSKEYLSRSEPAKDTLLSMTRSEPLTRAEKRRDGKLRWDYGITLLEYNRMFTAQEGCCAICKTAEPGRGKHFFVDHEHVSKRIRGLLCSHCNLALGKFRDDPELLLSAATYLEHHAQENRAGAEYLGPSCV